MKKSNKILAIIKANIIYYIVAIIAALLLAQVIVMGLDIISINIDNLLTNNEIEFNSYLLNLIILTIIGVVFAFIKTYLGALFNTKVMSKLREDIAKKLVKMEFIHYKEYSKDSLVSTLFNDVERVKLFLSKTLIDISANIVTLVIISIYIFSINKLLLLATIISYPFVFFAAKLISKRNIRLMKLRKELITKEQNEVTNMIEGIDVIKSYNLYNTISKKFKKSFLDIFNIEAKKARGTIILELIRILLRWIPFIICLATGAYLVINAQITIGSLIIFLLIANRIFAIFGQLPAFIYESSASIIAIRELEGLLRVSEESEAGITSIGKNEDIIDLRNIRLAYGDKFILNDFNMTIKTGEKVAIVSNNEEEKKAIFKLICGFYTPELGDYNFFGTPFKYINLDYARSKLAIISQDVFLFSGTIQENISYGNERATFRNIEKACKLAYIDDFITNLPKGYNTQIEGSNDKRLSPLIKQKITLARAFLRKAEILLVNDLDQLALTTQEKNLLNIALRNMDEDITIINISNKLDNAVSFDNIFLLKNGRVIEKGNHTELLGLNGVYTKLYNTIREDELK